MEILWLRPDKPENISVGRHRLGIELEARGHNVRIQNTTFGDFRKDLSDDIDVIIGTTRLGAFVGTWKHIVSGTPLLVDHIDPISQLRRSRGPVTTWAVSQLEKGAFRIADHVMVVYEEELPRVRRHAASVTKTSLGVDYDRFSNPPSETIGTARTAVAEHVPEDGRVLLYVGGLEPPYRLQTAVDAMDHLDGWHFVVLGDGSQREWLEGVDANNEFVHYLGTVPYNDVPGYMHVADAGITLLDDANTLKILEYGAARLPVVHVKGEAEQVFDEMVTFCSLEPADVAQAVDQAHSNKTDRLAEFAKQRSWMSIADKYETVLEQLVREQ